MNFLGLLPDNDAIPPYDIGPEKQCPRCKEYWPLDGDFYSPRRMPNNVLKWQSWCRACATEGSMERNKRKKEQKELLLSKGGFRGARLGGNPHPSRPLEQAYTAPQGQRNRP